MKIEDSCSLLFGMNHEYRNKENKKIGHVFFSFTQNHAMLMIQECDTKSDSAG